MAGRCSVRCRSSIPSIRTRRRDRRPGYSRPHELEVGRTDEGGGLWATVSDVRMAGAIVKIEVFDAARQPIQIELGREQYERIRVIIGETVYVKPRRVRVFMDRPVAVVRSPWSEARKSANWEFRDSRTADSGLSECGPAHADHAPRA